MIVNISQHFKYFTRYTPDLVNVIGSFLKDEEGNDWYEVVSVFDPDLYKVAYDKSGFITCISKDASMMFPENCSVIEVNELPEDLPTKLMEGWEFIDGEIRPLVD